MASFGQLPSSEKILDWGVECRVGCQCKGFSDTLVGTSLLCIILNGAKQGDVSMIMKFSYNTMLHVFHIMRKGQHTLL